MARFGSELSHGLLDRGHLRSAELREHPGLLAARSKSKGSRAAEPVQILMRLSRQGQHPAKTCASGLSLEFPKTKWLRLEVGLSQKSLHMRDVATAGSILIQSR